jgi:hypothetical protein
LKGRSAKKPDRFLGNRRRALTGGGDFPGKPQQKPNATPFEDLQDNGNFENKLTQAKGDKEHHEPHAKDNTK